MSNEPGEDEEFPLFDDEELEEKQPYAEMFPNDEMSTGATSSLIRRAQVIVGTPALVPPKMDPSLKPMTAAQFAFRPSAPTNPPPSSAPPLGARPAPTGSYGALKQPATGTTPAYKPTTGTTPAYKPGTGTTPAFRPSAPTNTTPAYKPKSPTKEADENPVFDSERIQSQIRAMSMTDSALGRSNGAVGKTRPSKPPTSAVEDTFVKQKMKQAENNVPDFNLDEDL